ncbi:MAG: tetratricopeptide repeat protein [Candidatus Yanofskybacteria bacterium]|nr:tetratricopeptide repeat protein [Candidatus Yanofskybacteria bacterium]
MDLSFWKKDTDETHDQFDQDQKNEYQYKEDVPNEEEKASESEVVESSVYYQSEPADPTKAKIYNSVSRWALYIGIFLLPLFFLPETSSPLEWNKSMLLIVVACVALISWLLGVMSSGFLAWRNNLLDKGILSVLLAFILATVFSVAWFKSVFGLDFSASNSLAVITALTIVYFLIVNNFEDKGGTLRSVVGFSVVVAIVYGLSQLLGINILRLSFTSSRAFNTVGSANALGILAAASLPFLSRSSLGWGWIKNLHLGKIGVALALVVLTLLNWWVLWLVVIAGMVAMIVFESLGGAKFRITKLRLPMVVIVLAVFMVVVGPNLGVVKDKLPIEVAPSFSLSRDVAMSTLRENMFFGYGPENFSVAFDKYGASKLANSNLSDARFTDAQSELMTLVVQGGLAMVIALAFLLLCLSLTLRRFYSQVPGESTGENIGVLASMSALIVGLFLYPFNMTLMSLFYVFMGMTALVIYDKNRREFNLEERTSLSLISSLGFIGALILVLVGVYFNSSIFMSDIKYAQALSEKDNKKAAEVLVGAIGWNNQDDRYYRTASRVALQLLSGEINKPADTERNTRIQNYLTTSISLAKRATEINPRETLNWTNLGFVYGNLLNLVDGVDKLSEDAYLESIELRPGDPIFNYNIGLLHIAKLDRLIFLASSKKINQSEANTAISRALADAEDNFKKSIKLSPNFGLAIYNLGVVYDRQGKLGDAIEQIEKIIPANSNQPGLMFELGLLYYRAGRKDNAYDVLQRAIVLAPDYANARWYLALILEERRDLDGAIAQLERIISIEANKDNAVVLNKLEELRAGKISFPPGKVIDQKPLR